ncbi:Lactoylglutathione lyase [hydrothermal vent metagenome]|uniref:Glyoxalase I n=1 Tax=hydrothermal vent metagenome TaxID=652676 RepID=A0A3B0ZMK5_9ZZZZ
MQKILHTMLRVGDMQRSEDFYTQIIGMRVLRRLDQAKENYTLTFLGFGEESDSCVLELTYNYGTSQYNMGDAYGHIAISVNDCHAACTDIKSKGGNVTYGPTPLSGSNEIIAFVVDPDGYQIELIQRPDKLSN